MNNPSLKQRLDSFETDIILESLRHANGNKERAAKYLGINRTTLVMKMKRLGLHHLIQIPSRKKREIVEASRMEALEAWLRG